MASIVVYSAKEAHSVMPVLHEKIRCLVLQGKPARIEVAQEEDERTVAANRYYWGAVLKQISEQSQIDGQKYTAEIWHEFFKRQFLGYRFAKVKLPFDTETRIERELRSTADLKKRAWAKYILQVEAFGADELGVKFPAFERKYQ